MFKKWSKWQNVTVYKRMIAIFLLQKRECSKTGAVQYRSVYVSENTYLTMENIKEIKEDAK